MGARDCCVIVPPQRLLNAYRWSTASGITDIDKSPGMFPKPAELLLPPELEAPPTTSAARIAHCHGLCLYAISVVPQILTVYTHYTITSTLYTVKLFRAAMHVSAAAENHKNRFLLSKESSSNSAQARYCSTKQKSGLFRRAVPGPGFRP